MKQMIGCSGIWLLLSACSPEPVKPQIPALTPETANQLLHQNSKASGWLEHAKRQDPSCAYDLEIPDQPTHPTQLDFTHIMKCGGRAAPLELDASVSFAYDGDEHRWTILRFSD